MQNQSLWQTISKRSTEYPRLSQNLEVDVLIIGAGITGMTAAQTLLKGGKTVAIVDSYRVGGVTTGSSTGNLYIPVQPFYQNVVSAFDLKTAKEIAKSRAFAIDYIEKNVTNHDLSCHFTRRPWYAYAKENIDILEKELETFKQMQLDVDYTDALPFDLKAKKAILMPNQARFNPLQYVISMMDILSKQGCQIYEDSHVVSLEEGSNYCTLLTEQGHKITAKKVFLATHTPIGINATQMFTAPYRSYVVGARLKIAQYPDVHLWKLDEPTFAPSTHAIGKNHPEILLVAGAHHKVGQEKDTKAHYAKIESFLKKEFEIDQIEFHWSAQHYHAADKVPYIGLAHRHSKHVYMATGYFADGLIYGTLGGLIVADKILRNKATFKNVYKADRTKPLASLSFLIRENLNVFSEYMTDFPILKNPEIAKIKAGEGKIISIHRQKCGVSRDENNELHVVSAVCTHMKCIVGWNDAEKTWDCPCHGSRFKQTGEVIEGPAIQNLQQYQCDKESKPSRKDGD